MLCLVRNGVPSVFAAPLAVLGLLSAPVHSALAAPIFFGPTPYLSAADSPFDLSGLGTTMFLEDFEDGELNTPGVLFPGSRLVFGGGMYIDSVDADDGIIDGLGNDGFSSFSDLVCTDGMPGSCNSTVGFFFTEELGRLPTAAGMVWTDGSPQDALWFRVYDASYNRRSSIGPFHLGDGNALGATEEDRFFGVIDPDGIGGIALGVTNATLDLEADHLQYGLIVPEGNTLSLVAFSLGGFVIFRIR